MWYEIRRKQLNGVVYCLCRHVRKKGNALYLVHRKSGLPDMIPCYQVS